MIHRVFSCIKTNDWKIHKNIAGRGIQNRPKIIQKAFAYREFICPAFLDSELDPLLFAKKLDPSFFVRKQSSYSLTESKRTDSEFRF